MDMSETWGRRVYLEACCSILLDIINLSVSPCLNCLRILEQPCPIDIMM